MNFRLKLPALLVIIALLSFASQFLFNIVLSHVLKNGLYGNFNVAIQTFLIFSSILLLGTGAAAENFLAKYLKEHDFASAADYIRWNFRLIYKSSKWLIIFLIVLAIVMLMLHLFNLKKISTYHISFYLLFLAPLGAISSLLIIYLQCNDNIVSYNVLNQCGWSIISTLVLGSFFYLFHPVVDNLTLWLFTFSVICMLLVLTFAIFYKKFPRDIVYSLLDFKNKPTIATEKWRKTANQLCVDQIVYAIFGVTGLYAVKFFTSGNLAIDQYSAILTISSIVNLLASSIYSLMAPKISFNVFAKNAFKLQQVVNRCNLSNLLTTTIVLLLIIFFGKDFLSYFGMHYVTQESYLALIILSVGCFIGSFGNASYLLLAYSDNQQWVVYLSIGQFVILAILAVIFALHFGIIGVAFATAFTITLQTIVSNIIARNKTHVKPLSYI